MRWGKFLLSLLAAAVISGCAVCARPVLADDPINPKCGYIFGRFYLSKVEGSYGIALNINGLNSETNEVSHGIRLVDHKRNVYAIEVEPGKYSINEILFLASSGTIVQRKPFRPNNDLLMRTFEVKPNSITYIGDYIGSVTWEVMFNSYKISINSILDNMEESWGIIEKSNPGFLGLDTNSIFHE